MHPVLDELGASARMAALTPPQSECPTMRMWRTCRRATANSMVAAQLRSAACTWLAMLRCTKTSPAVSPMSSFAGTRASEQPIQKNSG